MSAQHGTMDPIQFREFLLNYRMPGFDEGLPAEIMVQRLVTFRFPFSRESMGEAFVQDVNESLLSLPLFLLQALTYYQFQVQLDTVHDIGGMMDIGRRSLYLHRYFMMDATAYELRQNPVFPYGITETLLHELGHFLDVILTRSEKLSFTPLFKQAIRQDIKAIAPEDLLDHETRVRMCQEAGGYLKLSSEIRERVDLALFCLQPEETFSEAFLYLASGGRSREVIPQYFPNSIAAVHYLVGYHLKRWQPSPL